jgi:hypothetical protein
MTEQQSKPTAEPERKGDSRAELSHQTVAPPVSGSSGVGVAGGTRGANSNCERDVREQSSFVTYVHEYIADFIKFADQKAAFIFAGASGLLAVLYDRGGRAIWHVPVVAWRTHEWLACASMTLTVLSAILAIAVVAPRLSGKAPGLIYWNSISRLPDAQAYCGAIAKLDLGKITEEVGQHCFELAQIAKRKYELLRWAIWSGVLGLAAGGVYLLFF